MWLGGGDDDEEDESVSALSSGSPDYTVNGSKPPLPLGLPKPPPRSRPRSWTSTLFNAIKNSGTLNQTKNTASTMTLQPGMGMGMREPSSLTLSSMRTGDLGRSGRQKSVRFLANPNRNLREQQQKFYSLPRFIQQPLGEKMAETVKAKARSRTPSPFSRFVKSLVSIKDKGSTKGKECAVCFVSRDKQKYPCKE